MDDLEAGKLTECCELLNSITNQAENKKCFDCADNYSPRYLCTTFSTFVCSCCASVHQELGHKIKVLSVFGFTENEIKRLKATGNKAATFKWLARWKPELYSEPDPTSPTYKDDARKYMNAKYVEKRWVKLPPPLPIKKDPAATRDGADISPRSDTDASPRSNTDISPRSDTDVSPRTTDMPPLTNDDVMPRSGAPLSCSGGIPKTNSSIEKPRSLSSSGGVSSRKSMEVPKGWDAVMSEEVPVKQRDGEKPKNPFLDDDEPFPATPVRYSYMAHTPQMFIHPVSFPPGQYGYPQYPVPLDLNGFTPYYPHPSPHQFQTPLYSYPYDPHSHMHPLPPAHDSVSWVSGKPSAMHDFAHECTHQQDSLAWATKPQDNTVWASARPAERMLTQQYSCRDLSRAYEGMPKPPVLRSVSDNSLAASMRQAFGEDLPSSCTKCTHSQLNLCKVDHNNNTSETQHTINKPDENISKQESTVSKTEQSKQKLQGIMTKMTGLLKKAQNT